MTTPLLTVAPTSHATNTPVDAKPAPASTGFGHVLSQEMTQQHTTTTSPSNAVNGVTVTTQVINTEEQAMLDPPVSATLSTTKSTSASSATTETGHSKQDSKQAVASATPQSATAEMLALLGYAQPTAIHDQATASPSTDTNSHDVSAQHAPQSGLPNTAVSMLAAASPTPETIPAAVAMHATATLSANPLIANSKIPSTDTKIAAPLTPPLPDASSVINPQTMLNMQALSAALPSDATGHLAPRVGSTAWDEALSQRVVWMAHGAEQSASLSLNPPDLGPLRIVLNISNNQANATFIAQQPEVRQAIEAALPRLESMMNAAGIQLGQTNVRADTPNQQDSSAYAPQSNNSGNTRAVRSSLITNNSVANTEKTITGIGLVNTFV